MKTDASIKNNEIKKQSQYESCAYDRFLLRYKRNERGAVTRQDVQCAARLLGVSEQQFCQDAIAKRVDAILKGKVK